MHNHLPEHKYLFLLGLMSMMISMCLFGFALYLFPYLFFGWGYSVPDFVEQMYAWYQFRYNLGGILLVLAVYMPFFLCAFLFGYIAKLANKVVENEVTHTEELLVKETPLIKLDTQGLRLGIKILLFIASLLVLLFLVQYFIYIDTAIY